MPRKKRAYVPKVKGCYECSQRRIHCDRTQPGCLKCKTKGLQCSGFGIRYRFNDDLAIRGSNPSGRLSLAQPDSATLRPTTGNESVTETNSHLKAAFDMAGSIVPSLVQNEEVCASTGLQKESSPDSAEDDSLILVDSIAEEADSLSAVSTAMVSMEDRACFSLVTLSHLDPWRLYFLKYYAENVASEMVVIDDYRNGWRSLILPVAESDELVRDAVLSASTFHFALNVGEYLFKPNAVYHQAIRTLRKRQDLQSQGVTGKQGVVLALVVLLTTAMVSGHSDFRAVFGLLEKALDAVDGEQALTGELGVFLIRQIRKLRNYAAIHLDRDKAIAICANTATARPSKSDGWDCFRSYYKAYPNLQDQLGLLYDVNEQACKIYLARATSGSKAPPLVELVDKFKQTFESISPSAPGGHTLVWATFIAALESTTSEHRQYFWNILEGHYKRNGFANLSMALDHLKRVWEQESPQDWTQLLIDMPVFVV